MKNIILILLGKIAQLPFFNSIFKYIVERFYIKRGIIILARRTHLPFQILAYHRVLPQKDPFAIGLTTTDVFEKQIIALRKYFKIIPLSKLIMDITTNKVEPNSLCITFDDGYSDNYQHAYPILKKYDIPATIFLSTDFIGNNSVLWFDRVLQVIKNTKVSSIHINEISDKNFDLKGIKQKTLAVNEILELLKGYEPDKRDSIIDKLAESCETTLSKENELMLTWKQVNQMWNDGIEFGAHTKSHPILSKLDETDLINEIVGSKEDIELKTNKSVQVFAYPNGRTTDYDERSIKILEQAKFLGAVTTEPEYRNLNHHTFELPRLLPWDMNADRFLGRLLLHRVSN